jgi:hypothetical protein
MSLERLGEQANTVVDKFVDPTDDYTMKVTDYRVRPRASNALNGPITLTLPLVAAAKGQFYSIIPRDADAHNTVTIQDQDDSECWAADIVLNNACDRLLLYSDGLAWMPAFTGGFPGVSTTYPPGATTLAPTTQG